MKLKYLKSACWMLLAAGLVLGLDSCSKMDEYKKFVKGGEIQYPGIFDSLLVTPGLNRAWITGILISDPKVVKYRIFWNGGLDSLEAPFERSGSVDHLSQIVDNLPEGPISFEIHTYDASGNVSVPMNVSGIIYGDNFKSSIALRGNREVLGTILNPDGSVQLNWADVEPYVGVVGMHIHYFDAQGQSKDTLVSVSYVDQVTDLPNVSINQPISYNTLFIPNGFGIDTLTIDPAEAPLLSEVALANNQKPVKVAESDGSRWATLLDWTTSDNAKNHGGYGGTDISGGTDYKIFFEAGYGAPAIVDGKFYQKVTLPPGKYTFTGSVDWWNNGGQNQTYLVASKGEGLPNTSDLSSAIGYKMVDGGGDKGFSFELTEQTTVSVGLVLNLGDNGNSMRFNSLRLFINH